MNWTDVVFWSAMLFLMFASTVLSTQYTVEYPNATTAILYDGSTPYAQVELRNHVSNIGDKLRFNDCDLFDCKVKIAITPYTNIKINNVNEIRGWFDYNKKEVSYDGAELYTGTWAAYDGKMTLVAGTEYLFGLNYHKEDLRDSVDLIPSVFGADITEWAWWNSTFPYRVGFNVSNAGAVELTDFQTQFVLDLNETQTNGSSLRATWLNPATALEEEIPFWRSVGMFYNDTAWDYTTAAGSVWAKVPSIPVGTNTSEVYFYYSDFTPLPDESNATETFIDFTDCSTPTDGWTNAASSLMGGAGGTCYHLWTGAGGGLTQTSYRTGITVPTQAVIEAAFIAHSNTAYAFVRTNDTATTGYAAKHINHTTNTVALYKWSVVTYTAIVATTQAVADTWYSYQWYIDATTPLLKLNRNGTIISNADATYTYGGGLSIYGVNYTASSYYKLDDLRLRKGAVVFPTVSTQSVQETTGESNLYADTTCGSYDTLATFYFIDEQSNANTTANTTIGIAASGIGGGNFSISNAQSFRICKPNYAPAFTANITIDYWNNTAGVRNYYLAATNTTNTSVNLFLLGLDVSSAIRFHTMNQFAVGLPNRVQHYLRYFPANNTYALVAMGETDDEGYSDDEGYFTTNLFTNGTTFYQIISFEENSTSVEKLFSKEGVYCIAGQSCDHDLIIDGSIPLPEYWTSFYGFITYNCSNNTVAKTLSCTYADASGESHNFNLTGYKISYGNPIQACTAASSAASGTLICTINETNITGNLYAWRFTRASEQTIIANGIWDLRLPPDFADIGLGVAFILIAVSALAGAINPAIGVVFGVIGVVAAFLLGIIDISVTALAMLLIVAGILAWKVSRR